MNQTNRLRLADFAGGYGETVATDAGRGSPTRVGGEASVAGDGSRLGLQRGRRP